MKRIFLAFAAVALVSCNVGNNVKVNGQFVGENEQLMLVEKLSPAGSETVDSIMTDEEGNFSFTIKNVDAEYPSFYNIRTSTSYLPLLVKAGERVSVSSVGNIHNNYSVEGSEGSVQIRRFNNLINRFTISMDSIMRLYSETDDTSRLNSLGDEYGKLFIQRKRDAIKFITQNASSMVSILPLYQPFSDGTFLFEDPDDIFYFRIVCDSLSKYFPESPYTRSLKRDVERVMGIWSRDSLLSEAPQHVVDFPEIEMKSSAGKMEKLSSYKGKVIILSFTASNPVAVKVRNRELQEMYEKNYKDGGEVVVFQVWLDTDKLSWLQTLNAQGLPWINVCDFRGATSPAVGVWNVQEVPSSFLISPEGDIIGKNLTLDEMKRKIDSILRRQ